MASLPLSADNPMAGNATGNAVPPYFQKLIDAGNVQFEFYDPKKDRRSYRGFTEYKLFVSHSYSVRYSWTRRRRDWQVTIWPVINKVTCQLTHTMYLPKHLDSDDRWDDRLVKHEFDHVAISTDPRVRMLVEHLLGKLQRIDVSAPVGTVLDDKFVKSIVDQRIAERREAVIKLIEANQQQLDEVTRRGTRWTPDREAFLRSLYTEGNLEQAKFPYAADVKDLLRTDAYRNAKLPYALDDKKIEGK